MSNVSLPADYLYSSDHEWIDNDAAEPGDTVRVGITHVAADQLGEIVYGDLPDVGTEVEAGEAFGEVESTKSVSDIFAPVSGEVVSINEDLGDDAGVINSDPYGDGWLYEVRISDLGELLDQSAYAAENDIDV